MKRLTIRNSDGSVSQPTDLKWAEALEKLAEYEDAEENGTLIKLPYKVGDKVYVIEEIFPSYRHFNILYKRHVKEICISSIEFLSSQILIRDYDGFEYLIEEVFFTHEDAEVALKE